MLEKIQETAAFIKAKMHTQPETAGVQSGVSALVSSSALVCGISDVNSIRQG